MEGPTSSVVSQSSWTVAQVKEGCLLGSHLCSCGNAAFTGLVAKLPEENRERRQKPTEAGLRSELQGTAWLSALTCAHRCFLPQRKPKVAEYSLALEGGRCRLPEWKHLHQRRDVRSWLRQVSQPTAGSQTAAGCTSVKGNRAWGEKSCHFALQPGSCSKAQLC